MKYNNRWKELAVEKGVSIFGAGRFARDLALVLKNKGITVHAFLTSGQPVQAVLDGVSWHQVQENFLCNHPVWIGVFNYQEYSRYAALNLLLTKINPNVSIVWPQEYYGWLGDDLGFRFWLHPLDDYKNFEQDILKARSILLDNESKDIFDAILRFRSERNFFTKPPQPQKNLHYLPDWLRDFLSGQNVSALRFVDGGAFHGETLRELSNYASIERAWAFEPDLGSFMQMVQQMRDWPSQATLIPAGLSSRSGSVSFTPGDGESSRVNEQGTHHVPVVALDECLHQESINFIKLDVEGHEIAALSGARTTLQRNRPTLAIAGYHRWDDLWKIPNFIHSLDLNYRIRIGLHEFNTFETVFYAY